MNRWIPAVLVAGCVTIFATTHEAEAQFYTGGTELHEHYDIMFQSTVVGHMVAVSHDSSTYSGFASGKEYWWWDTGEGQAWRGSFRVVPTTTTYDYADKTWEVHDLDHFDLDSDVEMPSVTLTPDDRFYEVQEVDESTTPYTYETVAYMWLDGGANGTQIWYGIDGTLANDLVGVDADAVKMRAMENPPSAGSIDVNLLCDGECL